MSRRAGLASTLAIVFSLLPLPASAGGFCQEPGSATEGEGTTVVMAKSCYNPTLLRTEEGATVAFVNKDTEPHTVTSAGGAWGDAHKEVMPGEVLEARFPESGVYSYTCLLHPGMTGTIVVGEGTGLGAGASFVGVKPLSSYRPAARVVRTGPDPSTATWIGLAVAAIGLALGYAMGRRRRTPELAPLVRARG